MSSSGAKNHCPCPHPGCHGRTGKVYRCLFPAPRWSYKTPLSTQNQSCPLASYHRVYKRFSDMLLPKLQAEYAAIAGMGKVLSYPQAERESVAVNMEDFGEACVQERDWEGEDSFSSQAAMLCSLHVSTSRWVTCYLCKRHRKLPEDMLLLNTEFPARWKCGDAAPNGASVGEFPGRRPCTLAQEDGYIAPPARPPGLPVPIVSTQEGPSKRRGRGSRGGGRRAHSKGKGKASTGGPMRGGRRSSTTSAASS